MKTNIIHPSEQVLNAVLFLLLSGSEPLGWTNGISRDDASAAAMFVVLALINKVSCDLMLTHALLQLQEAK